SCQPGQMVLKGQVLFRIDSRPYEAELAKATAEVRRAEARVTRSKVESDNTARLAKNKSVSATEVVIFMSEHDQAVAALQAAQATRDLVKLNVEFATVKAPITGSIIGPVLAPGNVATADRTTLATLISRDPMYVYIDVNERTVVDFTRLHPGGTTPGS